MECGLPGEDLSAYVDGELDGTRAAAVEAHLRQCPRCHSEAAALRRLRDGLGRAVELDAGTAIRARLARRLALTEEWPDFTCARTQGALSAHLDGELPPPKVRELFGHLDQCPACSQERASLARVVNAVRALPEVEPPLSLERAVRVAIARQQRRLLPGWLRGDFGSRLAPGLAPVAAAAMLAVGFWLGRSVPPTPPVAPLARHEVRTDTPTVVFEGTATPTASEAQPRRVVRKSRPAPVARREDAPVLPPASVTGPTQPTAVKHPRPAPANNPVRTPVASHEPDRLPVATPLPPNPVLPPEPPVEVATAPAPAPTPSPTLAPAATTPADGEPRPAAPEYARVALRDLVAERKAVESQEERRARLWEKARHESLEFATEQLTSRANPETRAVKASVLTAKF